MTSPSHDKHNHHDHNDNHSGHDHKHHDAHATHTHHDHAPTVDSSNIQRILWVFIITAGYAVIQAIGGWLSGSLALIADAGHMVSDAAALLLALIAYKIAARAPDKSHTYGYQRVRVLAALANGAALLLLVVWILWEAIARFKAPTPVLAGPMLIVAVIGLGINILGAYILMRGNQSDGNLHGALLHVIGDLLGSVGAIAAAIGIMFTGWTILDPILSVFVSLLVVKSAWRLVMNSIFILLQGVPKGLDIERVESAVKTLEGIDDAGHFHAWTLTDESVIATIHVTPKDISTVLELPKRVADYLKTNFNIDHVTVQVDPPGKLAAPHNGNE